MENSTLSDEASRHWPLFTFFILVFLCGLIGNCLILYIYHFRMKKTTFGFFVQLLAMVDLTTVLVTIPSSFFFRLYSYDLDTYRMCKFKVFTFHFIALVVGFLFCIIAMERFRNVCHPHGQQITRSLAKKLFGGIICLSLVLSLPLISIAGVADTLVRIDENNTIMFPVCDYETHVKESGQSIIFAIVVDMESLGLACLLTVLYFLIWKTIRARRKNANEGQNPEHISGYTTTVVFCIITFAAVVLALPLTIVSTVSSFYRSTPMLTSTTQILIDFALYLPYINVIVNPIVYNVTSKKFRDEFLSVCCLRRRWKNANTEEP